MIIDDHNDMCPATGLCRCAPQPVEAPHACPWPVVIAWAEKKTFNDKKKGSSTASRPPKDSPPERPAGVKLFITAITK